MKIKVAICQVDMVWEHTSGNLERLESIIATAAADVVVLPEMFATGFKLKPSRVAQSMDGEVVSTMLRWAREYNKAIVGSVVIEQDGIYRNRQMFVKPSGELIYSDKRHLFRPGGEAKDYTPGNERVIVEYKGVRFLLLVCYDLRFPVWSRNRGDYDAIIYSASWDESRCYVWHTLMRARAIENQCYVVGVNRVGVDPDANYVGDSAVIDFTGHTVVDAGDGERTLVAILDIEAQESYKERFPAWMDGDDFCLKI